MTGVGEDDTSSWWPSLSTVLTVSFVAFAFWLRDRWYRLSTRERHAMRIIIEHRLKRAHKAATAAFSPASSSSLRVLRRRPAAAPPAHPDSQLQEEHTATSQDFCSRTQQTGIHESEH